LPELKPIISFIISLQLSVRNLSEICSVCRKTATSCPACFFSAFY